VPKLRLGVALLVPPPFDAEVDGLRRAVGARALARIPSHVTLVPPVNVHEDRRGEALARLRAAAELTHPLRLTLGPPATFLPRNPVVYLEVGGDLDELHALRHRVFVDPLARALSLPFVPHVTVADEAEPERIRHVLAAMADYRAEVVVDRVHLLSEDLRARIWSPFAEASFGAARVVGRGAVGQELELSTTAQADPEAAALLAQGGDGLVVTARREGRVVGAAAGRVEGDGSATLTALVVAPDARAQGIGSHVLAAFLAAATERGCTCAFASAPPGAETATFLQERGWAPAGQGRQALIRIL
jgi:2'-5' RNA ligase/GNAT superfamily N-acetyltransferase